MRIGGIDSSAISATTRRSASGKRDANVAGGETRALMTIEAAEPVERLRTQPRHPAAPFLAQLIATHMQAPQTRARRRAEPEEVIAIYAAANALRPGQPLRAFKRA